MKFNRLICLSSTILLLCTAVARADNAKVAFVVKGKLMVQNASAGKTRAANAAEKRKWRSVSGRINPVSPDGKYRMIGMGNLDDGSRDQIFRIVEAKSGKVVMDANAVAKAVINFDGDAGDKIFFDGWLPDSRHFAEFKSSHVSGGAEFARAVIDIKTKTRIAFNGWLAPNGKTALVSDQAGLMQDYVDYNSRDGDGINEVLGIRKWFTVSIKSLKNYRLGALQNRPLRWQKKPFAITGQVLATNDYGNNRGQRPLLVQFSPNGDWALLRSYYSSEQTPKGFPLYYLASISTGKMHKIPGTNAKFIS